MIKKITPLISALALALIVTSCFDMPKSPVVPTWDVRVNVPLMDDQIKMVDILDTTSSSFLHIYDESGLNDSVYFMVVNNIENTVSLQDSIKIPAPPFPSTTHLQGPATGGETSTGLVFNPDENYHLVSATFNSGRFIFTITNNTDNAVDFSIIVPGFKDRNNTDSSLTIGGNIAANTSQTYDAHVETFTYTELPVYEGFPLVSPYDYQNAKGFLVVLKANALNPVDLNLDISSSPMTVSELEGKIKRTELSNLSQTISTGLKSDISNFSDALRLAEADFHMGIETFGEMRNLKIIFNDMTMTGYNEDDNGNLVDPNPLLFNGSTTFSDSMIAGIPYQRDFNQTNTNINEFILSMPAAIKVQNNFAIDNADPDSNIVLSTSDSIKIVAGFSAPLIVSAKRASYDGTVDMNIDDSNRDDLNKILSAYITADIYNRIPIEVVAHADIIDQAGNVLFTIHDDQGNTDLTIPGAEVDVNGIATTPFHKVLKIPVTNQEMQNVLDGYQVRVSVGASSTGSTDTDFGPYVRIRANDFIRYKLKAGGVYHVEVNNN
jgi:hypothetical protein